MKPGKKSGQDTDFPEDVKRFLLRDVLSPHERRATRVLLAIMALAPLLYFAARGYTSLYSWIENQTVRELALEKKHTHRLGNGAILEFDTKEMIPGVTPTLGFKIWIAFLSDRELLAPQHVEGIAGFTSEIPVSLHLVDADLVIDGRRYSVLDGRLFVVNVQTGEIRQANAEVGADVAESFRAAFPTETFSPAPRF